MKPYRAIRGRQSVRHDQATLTKHSFALRSTVIVKLSLECGHEKTFEGDPDRVPNKRVRCPKCPDVT